MPRPSPKRRPLRKGAGGVRCTICLAHAAAKGDGSPIVLKHLPACPEFEAPHRGYMGIRTYRVTFAYPDDGTQEELELETPGWTVAAKLVPQILDRDYRPGYRIIGLVEIVLLPGSAKPST